jgi:hypothetical protein
MNQYKAMMHGMSAAGFLDSFVQDEVMCRCLDEEDFGQPLDNEKNDVALYDMYNRGLVACEQGLERNPLNLEGARLGTTGYIPSMEQGLAMGASPRPKTLVLELEEPEEKERMLSAKRRGLIR